MTIRASNMKIILASSSPRRLELLRLIGLEPEIMIPSVDEVIKPGETVEDFICRVTRQKGEVIYRDEFYEIPVVSSDTVVYINRTILGKPKDRQDAFNMLKILSGNVHEVMTGVGVLFKGKSYVDFTVTKVFFTKLSGEEIDFYLDNKEYADKAGAYGIQGKASVFVEKIEGCYFNVMGFPLNLFYNMLKKINIAIYR
jgi:septum formation protein